MLFEMLNFIQASNRQQMIYFSTVELEGA